MDLLDLSFGTNFSQYLISVCFKLRYLDTSEIVKYFLFGRSNESFLDNFIP